MRLESSEVFVQTHSLAVKPFDNTITIITITIITITIITITIIYSNSSLWFELANRKT